MIRLKYCTIEWLAYGSRTNFPDGTSIESFPHDIPHYYVIAHRCGYGDDLLAYCREHDFFHAFCEEYFYDRVSGILWSLAHKSEVATSVYEESIVQTCQRWIRANERPVIGNVSWDEFKQDAIGLLSHPQPN